jgi:hypothetical protein
MLTGCVPSTALACPGPADRDAPARRAETLANVNKALVDGGFLMFFEMTNMMPTLLWGLDEQCWQFTDKRAYGLWTTIAQWEELLLAGGFEPVRASAAPSGTPHLRARGADRRSQAGPA